MASITINVSGNHELLQITDISETAGITQDQIDLEITVFGTEESFKTSTSDYTYSEVDITPPSTESPLELAPSDFLMTEDAFIDGVYKYTVTFKNEGVEAEVYSTTYMVFYNNDVLITLDVLSRFRTLLGDKNTKYLDDALQNLWDVAILDGIIMGNVVGLLQESLEINDHLTNLLENN